MLILTVLHGKGYYGLGYYSALFAVGAVWWQAQVARPAVRVALLGLPVVLWLPLVRDIFPILPPAAMARLGQRPLHQKLGLNRWEDGKIHAVPQDFADMLGWQELADKAWLAYRALPDSTRARTLIKCDNYGQAGALNYYNRNRPMPAATSFNGSYLYWFPAWPARPYKHLLLIGEGRPAELAPYFQTFRKVGEVTHPYAMERGTTLYLGTDPNPALLARAAAEHRQELAAWEGNLQ